MKINRLTEKRRKIKKTYNRSITNFLDRPEDLQTDNCFFVGRVALKPLPGGMILVESHGQSIKWSFIESCAPIKCTQDVLFYGLTPHDLQPARAFNLFKVFHILKISVLTMKKNEKKLGEQCTCAQPLMINHGIK